MFTYNHGSNSAEEGWISYANHSSFVDPQLVRDNDDGIHEDGEVEVSRSVSISYTVSELLAAAGK